MFCKVGLGVKGEPDGRWSTSLQGNYFTSGSFSSKIDRKGRAIITAEIRKLLSLRFSSEVLITIERNSFPVRLDERGRFSIPSEIRKNFNGEIEGKIRCIMRQGVQPPPRWLRLNQLSAPNLEVKRYG
ncbi:MAG: hypothetical protein HY362_01720 [Candidatus Aenigmarchaeota archaeon]|nr:hypothetical protein [Candidatus Aenigmarchaeota archaeon]